MGGLASKNDNVTCYECAVEDDTVSWDDYFMSVAILSSYRSKDPSRKVGACIVDGGSNKILGIGYNGFPRGCQDSRLPWGREGTWLETKYPYVCHAEMNAIMNKNATDLKGATLYVTLFPCNECAKLIIQSGISEVSYLQHKPNDASKASMRMFDMANVHVNKCIPVTKCINIDLCV